MESFAFFSIINPSSSSDVSFPRPSQNTISIQSNVLKSVGRQMLSHGSTICGRHHRSRCQTQLRTLLSHRQARRARRRGSAVGVTAALTPPAVGTEPQKPRRHPAPLAFGLPHAHPHDVRCTPRPPVGPRPGRSPGGAEPLPHVPL